MPLEAVTKKWLIKIHKPLGCVTRKDCHSHYCKCPLKPMETLLIIRLVNTVDGRDLEGGGCVAIKELSQRLAGSTEQSVDTLSQSNTSLHLTNVAIYSATACIKLPTFRM
jgi:hypothetical protein